MSYDQELKYKWDNENARAYRDEQVLEKGIEKGERKTAISIARELKHMGLPVAQIVTATKLPIEEVVAL